VFFDFTVLIPLAAVIAVPVLLLPDLADMAVGGL
jgi:hypothetical protein